MSDPNAESVPFPDNLEHQELRVLWSPIKTDALGNVLILSGKLLNVDESDRTRLLRHQPFSIFLARKRENRLDWSKGAVYEQTMMIDGLSDENGSFIGSAELSKTDLALDKGGNVQVALAPARVGQQGQERWVFRENDRPAISSSVALLQLPPPPSLAPATFELNRLRRWPQDDLDGTQLLRTALALQRAGKDASLRAINSYIEGRTTDGDLWTSNLDDECVIGMITHLVFEPKEGSPSPPSYICLFGFDGSEDAAALTKQWPNGSVMFAGGIPFVAGKYSHAFAGVIPPIDRFTSWIKEHGRIRDQSFEPTLDPLNAAEKLLNTPFIQAITDKNERPYRGTVQINHIRRQALAMVGLPADPEFPHYAGPAIPEGLWHRLIEQTRSNPIIWNQELKRFDAVGSSPRYRQLINEAMK